MAPSPSSTDSDARSDSAYGDVDDVLSEFFTFSTPLSFDGSGLLKEGESTDSIPDFMLDEEYSGTSQGHDSPRWIPLSIGPAEEPLPCDISVPEPPYTRNREDECNSSFQSSFDRSFIDRRRPAEYIHRPPVWRIKPLSPPESDSDTDATSESGVSDHLNSCQFCSAERAKNFLEKKPMSDCKKWVGSQNPSLGSKAVLVSYEKQWSTMASVWTEEPFIIAMASLPDFDLTWTKQHEGSPTQSKDKGKVADDPHYHSSSTNSESPLLSKDELKAKDQTTQSSSGQLKRSLSSKGKGNAWDEHQGSSSLTSLKRSLQSKSKDRDGSGSQSPSCMDSENDCDGHKRSLRLTDPNCPAKSEACSKPTCKTSVPGSNIPEGDKPDSSGDASDNEFVSAQSEHGGRDGPERRPSWKRGKKSTEAGNPSTAVTQSPAGAGLSGRRERNPPEIWNLVKQGGFCFERILNVYKDIRVAPTENGASYGIRSGSRVICVGDTDVRSPSDDEFRLEMGEAFIVVQMYGDLWASCLRLSLTDAVTSPLGSAWMTQKKDHVLPISPKDIKFLPLCSVTLEANFGEYIRRRSNPSTYPAKILLPDPCNGQRVVPPGRIQSKRAAKAVVGGGSILIPRWMIKECTDIYKMPDARLTIPRDDKDPAPYGHVEGAVPSPPAPRRGASSTDERYKPDRSWFLDRQQIEDKLSAKNGRLFGVGKMKRTQSSADHDTITQNTSPSGPGTPAGRYPHDGPDQTGSTSRNSADGGPKSERVAADTVRTNETEPAFPGSSSTGTHSPHRSTSQVASSLPNPPEALAGSASKTQVRDFASPSAASGNLGSVAANPNSNVSGGTGEDTVIPSSSSTGNTAPSGTVSSGAGAGSIPSDAAPGSPNPSGFPSTVVRSSAAHKEAFSSGGQGSSAVGSQPYVTEGEISASQVSVHRSQPTMVRTEWQIKEEESAQKERSGRKLSSLASDKWTRLSQIWRNRRANRRTQSDLGP